MRAPLTVAVHFRQSGRVVHLIRLLVQGRGLWLGGRSLLDGGRLLLLLLLRGGFAGACSGLFHH